MVRRILILGAFAFTLLACTDDAHVVSNGDECTSSDDCLDGEDCENGQCVGWTVTEECEDDTDCDGDDVCEVGAQGARVCVAADPNQTDPNQTDPNQTDPNQTDPNQTDLDPFEGTTTHTLCGAGGVSNNGEGLNLYHCVGPVDGSAPILSAGDLRLQSGGFTINTAP